jgi:hypothetical protein
MAGGLKLKNSYFALRTKLMNRFTMLIQVWMKFGHSLHQP